jgi:hypothetical protein
MAEDDVAASGRAAEQRWLRRVVLRRQASASHLVQSLLLGRDAWRSTICMASGWLRVLELDQHPGCSRRPNLQHSCRGEILPSPVLASPCLFRAPSAGPGARFVDDKPLASLGALHGASPCCYMPYIHAAKTRPRVPRRPLRPLLDASSRCAQCQAPVRSRTAGTGHCRSPNPPPPPAARKRALPSRPRVRLLSQGVAQAPKTLLCSAHILRRPLAVSARCSPPPAVVCPTTRPPREIAQLPPTGTALHLPAVRLLPGGPPIIHRLTSGYLGPPAPFLVQTFLTPYATPAPWPTVCDVRSPP